MPYLMLLNDKGMITQEWNIAEDSYSVGRGTLATLQIQDPFLSRQHFELSCEANHVRCRDLQSRGGTRVNHKKIDSMILKAGDMIEAGESTFYYEEGESTLMRKSQSGSAEETHVGMLIRDLRLPSESPHDQ